MWNKLVFLRFGLLAVAMGNIPNILSIFPISESKFVEYAKSVPIEISNSYLANFIVFFGLIVAAQFLSGGFSALVFRYFVPVFAEKMEEERPGYIQHSGWSKSFFFSMFELKHNGKSVIPDD